MAHSFDIAHAVSQVKILVPLLEMMKIDKYRNTVIKLISDTPNQNIKDLKREQIMCIKKHSNP